MSGVFSLAAACLAAVLTWAGIAKARRPVETTREFRQLGLPAPAILARVVPIVELTVALVLVVEPGWGGVLAFGLLAGFTALLVSIIRSGRVISCGCFGSTSNQPVTSTEVARNVVLLVLAAGATTLSALHRPTLPDVVAFSIAVLLAALAIGVLAFHRLTGTLWRTELAGELHRSGNRDGTAA
mgnify:CR=1 FL=1